jgi:endo-1,4-beta-xylanase
MEFVINAASSATNTNQYQLYWNSGNNEGLNDNTMWGDVLLTGYSDRTPMQLNTFMLKTNIQKATPAPDSTSGLVCSIWVDETELDSALSAANTALATATTQAEIDYADLNLDRALRGNRRKSKYPDPYELPTINNLPDPFTFFDGKKVRSVREWAKRRAEINLFQ